MYFIDDNQTVSNPIPDSSSARNTGLKRRHGICTAKPTFHMNGPLHVDVFNQSKYMLNVTLKVRMTHSKHSFVLMTKSDVTESLESTHINGKIICEKIVNHTKSLPGTRTHSPTKNGKVSYNTRGV